MNPVADLKADGLRTLFIYIVPGGIASLPWICLFVHEVGGVPKYADDHQPLAAVVLLLLCLTVGKLTDGMGTLWEFYVNDVKLAARADYPNFQRDWSQYIRTAFVHEPVAVGYIENLTQTLKFELNIGVALTIFAISQLALVRVLKHFSAWSAVGFMVAGLLSAAFAFWSSYGTSTALASVRKWLSEGVLVKGDGTDTSKAG